MQAASYISETMTVYEGIAKYDAAAKNIFKDKKILAHILKECAVEFKECSIEDIEKKYIEGDILVSKIGVDTDTTHGQEVEEDYHPVIAGKDTEQKTTTEGSNYYDILFDAVAPDGDKKIRLIINLEIQSNENKGYPIVKRGLYYCSRMISAQYGPVFVNKHYEKIRKVYSIWIIVDPRLKASDTITRYELTEKNLWGNYHENVQNYDLLNVVMIRLSKSSDTAARLMRLVYVCLSDMPLFERKNILEKEYNIPTIEMEGTDMCNLGIGIYNKGVEQGIKQGVEQGEIIGAAKTESRYSKLVGILTKAKRYDDLERISDDKEYLHELMEKLVPVAANS